MLIIKVKKVQSSFHKIILPYMYKVDTGLYVGDVTRKIYEQLLEQVRLHIGTGECVFIWKNAKSSTGFDITGVGSLKCVDLDGLRFIV
jgi:CRISPR-associated endoribonuclease Cas2 subtype I-E